MNIEDNIKEKKEVFDTAKMPNGHQERFAAKLQEKMDRKNRVRRLWISIPSAVAAVALVILMIPSVMNFNETTEEPANKQLVEMRRIYDERVNEAISHLENVLVNVDDSTRMEINNVISDLTNTSAIFAEMAPLPEEKQMAIASQIYDNQLETIQLITEKINK